MDLPCSNAHCCLPPSISRRLFGQELCDAVLRARTIAGSANAATATINTATETAMTNLLHPRDITLN